MSTIKVNSIIPVAGVPTGGGGGIIQLKTTTKTDNFTTTSSSYVDVPSLSVDIAVINTSHKVLIRYDLLCGGSFWNSGPLQIKLVVDSTEIAKGTGTDNDRSVTTFQNFYANNANNSNQNISTSTAQFLYTPGDTNNHTYKIQVRMQNSNDVLSVNRTGYTSDYGGISTLTLMEVSA